MCVREGRALGTGLREGGSACVQRGGLLVYACRQRLDGSPAPPRHLLLRAKSKAGTTASSWTCPPPTRARPPRAARSSFSLPIGFPQPLYLSSPFLPYVLPSPALPSSLPPNSLPPAACLLTGHQQLPALLSAMSPERASSRPQELTY